MSEEQEKVEVLLTPEDEQVLEISKLLRSRGKDPVKILKFYLDAEETLEKTIQFGKQAGSFILNQLKAFEKDLKKEDK